MNTVVQKAGDIFLSTRERKLLTLSAVSLAAVYVFCIVCLDPSDDIPVFYGNWLSLRSGELPYVDFSFGNPPLSLLFIAIPGALSSDLQGYYCLHAAEMMILAWSSVYLVMKISGRLGLNRFRTTALYFVVLLMYSEEIVKKLDMAVAITVLLALYMFLQRRFTLSYATLIIGAMIKVYPVVLIPVFIMVNLADRSDPRRFRNVAAGLAVIAAAAAIVFAAMGVCGLSVDRVVDVFTQQAGRDFQIESVMGNILQIFGMLGLYSYELVGRSYTYNVECAPADALSGCWVIVTVAAYILLMWAVWHFRLRTDTGPADRDRVLVLSSASAVLVVLLTFMIFSTQYMLWIITLLPFVIQGEKDTKKRRILQSLYLLQFVILVPLMLWLLFGSGEAFAAASVFVRNMMLLFILLYCIGEITGRRIVMRTASI